MKRIIWMNNPTRAWVYHLCGDENAEPHYVNHYIKGEDLGKDQGQVWSGKEEVSRKLL